MIYETTKRPWNCDPDKRVLTIGWAPTSYIKDEVGFPIANVRSKEDGELIVKCINMHDELVEALKACIGDLQTYVHGGNPNSLYKDEGHYFYVLGGKENLERAKYVVAKSSTIVIV